MFLTPLHMFLTLSSQWPHMLFVMWTYVPPPKIHTQVSKYFHLWQDGLAWLAFDLQGLLNNFTGKGEGVFQMCTHALTSHVPHTASHVPRSNYPHNSLTCFLLCVHMGHLLRSTPRYQKTFTSDKTGLRELHLACRDFWPIFLYMKK